MLDNRKPTSIFRFCWCCCYDIRLFCILRDNLIWARVNCRNSIWYHFSGVIVPGSQSIFGNTITHSMYRKSIENRMQCFIVIWFCDDSSQRNVCLFQVIKHMKWWRTWIKIVFAPLFGGVWYANAVRLHYACI